MLKILADSTCDLPQEILDKYQIELVPLTIIIEEKEYQDRVDIQTDKLCQMMREGAKPKTSQINLGQVYELLQKAANNQDDILFFTISSQLSGSYQAANLIVSEFQEKYPQRSFTIIDSLGSSLGAGLMILQAAKMKDLGLPLPEIIENVIFLTQHVEHIFALEDLTWIASGGRFTKTIGAAGNILGIKPILCVKKGSIFLSDIVRGPQNLLRKILKIVTDRNKGFTNQIIGLAYIEETPLIQDLKQLLEEKGIGAKFLICRIGCTLTAHLGLSGIGVFFFNEKPNCYILD